MTETTRRPSPSSATAAWLRARLVSATRFALVASVLPLAVFIGWLAAAEPKVMMLFAVALPFWIACDFEVPGLPRSSAQRERRALQLARGTSRTHAVSSDMTAVASWS
jgi:hypothetical protein